ncbi:hypothetical protein E7744_06960 [Citricoccus sp. SGAir0253]|uniref:hypothetical protein n=1 Tax=Citricoccus sp. SGAir0253 TaxID=2567881 RepID=UPI0010CD26EC|nr:hypothetical protein [Citricoccus sp. SGAir0253]QCU77951.1 hypothetical protein E7744_06960 [Citricoccus sp. SGAir0253]
MRSTRFILVLTGLVAVIALLTTGIVYAVNRTTAPTATDAPPSPAHTTPSPAAAPTDATTDRAWETTAPTTPTASAPAPPTGTLTRKGMSADELVTTAAQVMTTWDTTRDVSPTDGYRRALPLFVAEYRDIFVTPTKPVLPKDWWEAAEHEATSTPRVQITDTYAHGDTTTYYVVASWTWRSEDGWTLNPDPAHMTFQVAKDKTGYIIRNWTDQQLQ